MRILLIGPDRRLLVLAVVVLVQCGGSSASTASQGTDASIGSGGSGAAGSAATGGSAGAARFDGGAGATGTGGASGVGGSPGSGGSPDAAACSPACGQDRTCCDGRCANTDNDPLNCGACGRRCTGQTSYCNAGTCTATPCESGQACDAGTTCCGLQCCGQDTICCNPEGPVSVGPECVAPVNGTCPLGCAPLCKCASPGTPIATPFGDRPIASLGAGDLVYSVDHGQITAVPIVRTNRIPAHGHVVRRIALATGAVLEISAPHPTADGRLFGSLRAGDSLDGIAIVEATTIPYAHEATYDILPDSDTGAYFAGGALIGSTLAPGVCAR